MKPNVAGRAWRLRPADPAAAEALARAVGIAPVTAQLLLLRGISTAAAARDFFRLEISSLRDPHEIPGLREGVDRIHAALREERVIGIYGDYDVDGVSGTALLARYLKLHGRHTPTYIPHRTREGYGLNETGLRSLADQGVRLLITVDTGTTAHAAVAKARELGMEVVVLDHHAPDATLPEGAIVVNPMLADPPNPLASVGVAFKVVWALAERVDRGEPARRRMVEMLPAALALASLGTVADVCPLTGDNRILVALGLRELQEHPSVGLAALLRAAGLGERAPEASDIGFRLAPRLNAAGRMQSATTALELLLTDSESRAGQIAAELEIANKKRQQTEEEILRQAIERVEAEALETRRTIVLADDRWHSGVVGIVAARLVERYARPTFLIGMEDGLGRGSARTVGDFNLKEALSRCSDLLVSGGGHAKAGGMTIARERVSEFARRMEEVAADMIRGEELVPTLSVDLEVTLDRINAGLCREVERLAPFGIENPTPVLCARGLRVAGSPKVMGKSGTHLQMIVSQGGASIRAVGWGMAERADELRSAASIDLAFTVQENTWQGRSNAELIVKDVRIPS